MVDFIMDINNSQCLIIKIGSALLVNAEQQDIHQQWLASLIDDVVQLINQGKRVVLVSSGAIAFGQITTQLNKRPTTLNVKQALAAVGQVQLMHTYQSLFKQHQLNAAQVLITLEDTESRERFMNLRNTLNTLLDLHIVPIINENDSVTTAEICYGDNDRLAARVIQMVDADTLILLSDVNGLYTDDPRLNAKATLIKTVSEIDADIYSLAKASSSSYGSGGMLSKIDAAKIAVNCGCNMLITAGKHFHPITHYQQHQLGTWFTAKVSAKNAKKTWLKQHLKPSGIIIIDDGAEHALQAGASLLAVGITSINKHFSKGSAVEIINQHDKPLARGLVNFSSNDLLKIIGQNSKHFSQLLGYETGDTVIHRDNLVLL